MEFGFNFALTLWLLTRDCGLHSWRYQSEHATVEKKLLFPLESTENKSKDVLVEVCITGDKVTRCRDVVSKAL